MTEITLAPPVADDSRAKRLRALTNEVHDTVDRSIMSVASFDDLGGYARFLDIQYRLHFDVAALYKDQRLLAMFPDLSSRPRLSLVAADFADLGLVVPKVTEPAFIPGHVDVPTALGWLYVIEGSNMGAALLRKEVAKIGLSDDHGARHLAPAPDGPASHWRTFTAALNFIELSPEEETRVEAGARSAFQRVLSLIDAHRG